MNFLEAVSALQEGRCKKIQIANRSQYIIDIRGCISFDEAHMTGISLTPDAFLGEWELIGVKHKIVIEEVEWAQANSAVHPYSDKFDESFLMWKDLLNKPKMKMTLEWTS